MFAAVAQFTASTDKDANLDAVAGLIEQAARRGAALVVLPENAMYSNSDRTADITPDTETVDGTFGSGVSALARKNGIAVVAGMTEQPREGSAGRATNAVLAFDATGESLGVYRKVHLYDAFGHRESDRIQPHDPQALTFDIDGLTFGVMTCYDLRFPEMARFLVDAGAQALIVPAAWMAGPVKEDHWLTLARARAIENTAYVLASGQTGPICTGQSVIVDPMGTLVASAGEDPGVATGWIDVQRVESVRQRNPSLTNRKFDVVAR